MYCSQCGIKLADNNMLCPNCSFMHEKKLQDSDEVPLIHLPITENRECDITVWQDKIIFSGKFFYLKDKEIYKSGKQTEWALIHNYLGMGYLSQRSYRKTLLFLIGGTALELVKFLLDKLTDLVDKTNDYLKWVDRSISLPEWMNNTVNFLAILCIFLGVVLFFSKKKVIEISFTDKRICIPQKSISKSEYNILYQAIKRAKNMK